MPNTRSLREIVTSLRALVWKARDAGSPAASDVLTMAAGAVRDMASDTGQEPARRPEQVTRRLGRD